jgi:hypothetical protein
MTPRGIQPDRKVTGMANGDLRDQIARLEAEIEELAKTLEGSRKAMLLSKVAIAAGGIWILAYLFRAIGFDSTAMISAMAAVIGGIVVFGSNLTTSKQTTAAMKVVERQRAELIDMMEIRMVGESGVGLVRDRDAAKFHYS